MKISSWLLGLWVGFTTGVVFAQPLPPVTTTYTRDLLRAKTAAEARTALAVTDTANVLPDNYVTPQMLTVATTNAWKKDIYDATNVFRGSVSNGQKNVTFSSGFGITNADGASVFELGAATGATTLFLSTAAVYAQGRLTAGYVAALGTPGYSGDASGLTHLPGTAIEAGTIPASALDAATAAQLALAGTGGGGVASGATVTPDMAFGVVKGLLEQCMATNKVAFTSGVLQGLTAFVPGSSYTGAVYGDYEIGLPAYIDYVPASTVYAIMEVKFAGQSSGHFANRINFDSTPADYVAGPLDFFGAVDFLYWHFRQTGKPTAFVNHLTNIVAGISALNLTNNLIWTDAEDTEYYAADQIDSWGDVGFSSMASVAWYDANQKIAEMAGAAANYGVASNSLMVCSNVAKRVEAVFWDASASLLWCKTTVPTRHNVWATAWAASLGMLSEPVKKAVVERFIADWDVGNLYLPEVGPAIQASFGQYYPFAMPWLLNVLEVQRPDLRDEALRRHVGWLLKKKTLPEYGDYTGTAFDGSYGVAGTATYAWLKSRQPKQTSFTTSSDFGLTITNTPLPGLGITVVGATNVPSINGNYYFLRHVTGDSEEDLYYGTNGHGLYLCADANPTCSITNGAGVVKAYCDGPPDLAIPSKHLFYGSAGYTEDGYICVLTNSTPTGLSYRGAALPPLAQSMFAKVRSGTAILKNGFCYIPTVGDATNVVVQTLYLDYDGSNPQVTVSMMAPGSHALRITSSKGTDTNRVNYLIWYLDLTPER
jgi:hypothetical protein